MNENPLESLYDNELLFARKMAADFARSRRKIGHRLLLDHETGSSQDPHVERLLEGFALLTARIRLKLEDEFPELTESLLQTLYPHYLAPVPSLAIAQFEADPERSNQPEGQTIPKASYLYTREVDGFPCRFRTAYPVTLWPLELVSARYQTIPFGKDITVPGPSGQAKALVRLELNVGGGMTSAEIQWNRLRFFLSGDEPVVYRLYELLFNHATQVMVRPVPGSANAPPLVLPGQSLEQVGFGLDEGLLPYSRRSFPGYRLLTEYFSFPHKFLFVDFTRLAPIATAGFGERIELIVFLNRSLANLQAHVTAQTFRLGCTPIVNLFDHQADPIHLVHFKREYQVLPDVRRHSALEVYSIDSVESTDPNTHETVVYSPFYAFKHRDEADRQTAYWHMQRKPSTRPGDVGTDVFLSFVDLEFNPRNPPHEIVLVKATCSNRDLPAKLRAAGGQEWEFQLEGQAPVRRILPIVPPTAPARLPMGQLRWRLLSHLALNHLSITEGEDGAQALRELLRVYDYVNGSVSAQHIEGIVSVASRRRVAPTFVDGNQGFCRGIEVTVEFDDEKYAATGVFLFSAVLERFLGLYANINSVTRLIARTTKPPSLLKQWPYRVGEMELL